MLSRSTLERYQVIAYLLAIAIGLLAGGLFPAGAGPLEAAVWPILGLLLYTTFTQVPLTRLRLALSSGRFLAAALLGNFLVIPLLVLGLLLLAPDDPAIRLGLLLVLLVPCTDWFITFSHLGGGDARHALAFSPVSLLLQLVLLPVYLWLFLDVEVSASLVQRNLLLAFSGLVLLPLLAAYATERWAERSPARERLVDSLGWFPVPLLALVVLLIAASQAAVVMASIGLLAQLLPIFVGFLVIAALLARLLARLLLLPTSQGRVLAFSFGTRNSFVVLPLALALPASFELAVVVIVMQSLVELLGMAAYLWWIPKHLFPD